MQKVFKRILEKKSVPLNNRDKFASIIGKYARLKYKCKCGREYALVHYNTLKSHLYTCPQNKGYKNWQNIFDYFNSKNGKETPKWLECVDEKDLEFKVIDQALIEKFQIKPKYFTLNKNIPEFLSKKL
jgi:hypothetical protein